MPSRQSIERATETLDDLRRRLDELISIQQALTDQNLAIRQDLQEAASHARQASARSAIACAMAAPGIANISCALDQKRK